MLGVLHQPGIVGPGSSNLENSTETTTKPPQKHLRQRQQLHHRPPPSTNTPPTIPTALTTPITTPSTPPSISLSRIHTPDHRRQHNHAQTRRQRIMPFWRGVGRGSVIWGGAADGPFLIVVIAA